MRRIKAAIALFSGFVVALGINVLGASTAGASALSFSCDSSAFCLYENIDYGGGGIGFHPSLHPPGTVVYLQNYNFDNGHDVGNSASSMVNHTGYSVVLYDFCPRDGGIYAAKPHSVDKTLVDNNFNDKASCFTFS